ncbi:MAG: 2-phosphosulfolactate phosphatase [Planctomycetota bacterium]|jgi:2-phosphosulfolactate phosphatase
MEGVFSMYYDQSRFDVRLEWGRGGVEALAGTSDATVIVDVLSFSTCVDVAVGRGAAVLPCLWRDESAREYAHERGALLAQEERCLEGAFSLSPTSLLALAAADRIVLPSPNGSELSFRARALATTFTGCLRNRSAVARAAVSLGRAIAVIPAGERWPDGTLRPAWEDLVGAGAIVAALPGSRSPEAQAAADQFEASRAGLEAALFACSSGRELIERGFAADVALAAAIDTSGAAPRLEGDEFTGAA